MAAEGGLRGKGAAARAVCPACDRSVAVTWNKETGEAYLRPHKRSPGAFYWCVKAGETRTVSRELVR